MYEGPNVPGYPEDTLFRLVGQAVGGYHMSCIVESPATGYRAKAVGEYLLFFPIALTKEGQVHGTLPTIIGLN